MSTNEPPSAGDLSDRFPITALEAQAIADAMAPVQDIASASASVGSAFENAPGAGPPLVGAVLTTISQQVDMVSQSAEVIARAIDFYITAQGGQMEELFPPPDVLAEQLRGDIGIIRDLAVPGNQDALE